MIAFYAAVLLLAFWFKAMVLLYVWIVPALLGQPFLRLYLLAEHGRCPLVANMLENTRTTLTNWLVRKLAWNMRRRHHRSPRHHSSAGPRRRGSGYRRASLNRNLRRLNHRPT